MSVFVAKYMGIFSAHDGKCFGVFSGKLQSTVGCKWCPLVVFTADGL